MDRIALPPGTRLGELEIVRVLATGGFGIVYLARDHALERDVAVKEFMPALLAGRSHGQRVSVRVAADTQAYALGLQSFIDEARLLARLAHPAIVKVYRFWKGNGTGYMVMPHLRGPTLGDVRRSMSGPPTETWLRRLTEPLLDVLAVLHAEGFYHRDIAPDNVLVGDNGLPVLLDFGTARRVIADRTESLTAIVTPHYAPVEQYAEARSLRQGPWTDLYALGALLAYLIDGTPPPASTARALDDEMQTLALRRIPGVSRGFLAAIDWALAVRPQDRPQSVAELRDALAGRSTPPSRRPNTPARRSADQRPTPNSADIASAWPFVRPMSANAARAAAALRAAGVRRRAWAAAATLMAAVAMVVAVAKLPSERIAAPAAVVAGVAPAAPERAPIEEIIEGPPEVIIEGSAPAVGLDPPLAPLTARTMRVAAAPPKAKGSGTHRATERKLAARPRTPGPVELCAAHNFFVRPWCVQRRCDEPRFKGSAQCTPHRVARSSDQNG